jgi:hypothetical protein
MFNFWRKQTLRPDCRPNRGHERRRRVVSTPLVSELEGRTMLSGVGAAPAAVHLSHAYLMYLARTEFAAAGVSHTGHHGRARGAHPALAAAAPAIVAANPARGMALNSSAAGTGMFVGIPGTDPGGGLRLSGYLSGPDEGTAIPGTNPGGGPMPSGYLGGPGEGIMLPGTNPGGGPMPSGAL